MTEHSVTDNIDHMPTWEENLIFAEELNECMLAGCTGYIYWYLRAHWAFAGTGQAWTYNDKSYNFPENKYFRRSRALNQSYSTEYCLQ